MMGSFGQTAVAAGLRSESAADVSPQTRQADTATFAIEINDRPSQAETVTWKKGRDHTYQIEIREGSRRLLAMETPPLYRPETVLSGDADRDGRVDAVIILREEGSGAAVRYWLVKGGTRPRAAYLSEPYPQGQIALQADGLAVTYSVYGEGDANAFPSQRVTERWGGSPWRMKSQQKLRVVTPRVRAEADNGKNPPYHEIEEMLEDVARKYEIPAVLLKAIAWQESTWRQFDSNGQPLISFDGGIGIMQLTNQPRFDQNRLKTDIRYNIEAGAQVLLEKRALTRSGLLPPIGRMDEDELESWYFAVWAYNGWSVYNNPHNIPNKFRSTAAYQDMVYKLARDYFGQPITKIPKEQIPRTGVPSGRTRYETPQPVHLAGEDLDRRRLQKGDVAQVNRYTSSLNVRQSAGLSGKIVDTLKTNERVTILSRATERDGYEWYQIESKDGKGWAAGHYLFALRSERIALPEVIQEMPERLTPQSIKEDKRRLYLQADGVNVAWEEAMEEGGITRILQAIPVPELWLEWTDERRAEKLPKPSSKGFLRTISVAWGAEDVPEWRSVLITFGRSAADEVDRKKFVVRDEDGVAADVYAEAGKRNDEQWAIMPLAGWSNGETYTVYYGELPLTRFTVVRKPAVSVKGYKIYGDVETDVARNKALEIRFSSRQDEREVNAKNIWLENDEGKKVKATVSLSRDKRTITVKPEKALQPASWYFLKMNLDAKQVAIFRTAID